MKTVDRHWAREISELVEKNRAQWISASDRIWELAELRFEECQSANLLGEISTQQGFSVERGVGINPHVWHSVIAHWKMCGGGLDELILHLISLGFGQPREFRGVPQRTARRAPLEETLRLSEPFRASFQLTNSSLIWSSSRKRPATTSISHSFNL